MFQDAVLLKYPVRTPYVLLLHIMTTSQNVCAILISATVRWLGFQRWNCHSYPLLRPVVKVLIPYPILTLCTRMRKLEIWYNTDQIKWGTRKVSFPSLVSFGSFFSLLGVQNFSFTHSYRQCLTALNKSWLTPPIALSLNNSKKNKKQKNKHWVKISIIKE